MTTFMDALVLALRAYDEARNVLDPDERRVLRSILACRIARDVVDEELERDRDELEDVA